MNFIVDKHFTKNTEEYRKAQLYVWNATAGFTITSIMSILTSYSHVYGKVSYLPIAIMALISLIVMFYTGNLKLCIDITCMGLLASFIKPILSTGGVHSQIYNWIILIPTFALTMGDLKRGAFWTFMTIVVQIAVYKLDMTNLPVQFGSMDKFNALINHILFTLSILAMMFAYEYIKVKQQATIQEQVKSLLEQKQYNLEVIKQLQNTEKSLSLTNNELKSFAFAASHDLKELLRMISMHVQVLRKKLAHQIDASTEEHIYFVVSGVKNMELLLKDLIVHEQVGNQVSIKNRIDLNEICKYTVKRASVQYNSLNVDVSIGKLPTLHYFENEIVQLFQNLIDNALKFRRMDVTPSVSIACSESEQEYLFKITDNGMGIKEEFHEKVFSLFFRLNNRRDYEGSGIGLATCKKIVTYLGGQIWLESNQEAGITVYFTVPKSSVQFTTEITRMPTSIAA